MARYLKPPVLLVRMANPLVRRLGLATTLSVRTRRTGRTQRLPVNVLADGQRRLLVAMGGETEWVRNLRAAGECELHRRGWHQRFTAVELPVAERPEIIDRYRAKWGWQVAKFFTTLPGPDDHPVFELRPAD